VRPIRVFTYDLRSPPTLDMRAILQQYTLCSTFRLKKHVAYTFFLLNYRRASRESPDTLSTRHSFDNVHSLIGVNLGRNWWLSHRNTQIVYLSLLKLLVVAGTDKTASERSDISRRCRFIVQVVLDSWQAKSSPVLCVYIEKNPDFLRLSSKTFLA